MNFQNSGEAGRILTLNKSIWFNIEQACFYESYNSVRLSSGVE